MEYTQIKEKIKKGPLETMGWVWLAALWPRIMIIIATRYCALMNPQKEMAALGYAARLCGISWSDAVSQTVYDGYGAYIPIFWLFQSDMNPFTRYLVMRIIVAVVLSMIAPITYWIMHHCVGEKEPFWCGMLAVALSYIFAGGEVLRNEPVITIVLWLGLIPLMEMFRSRNPRRRDIASAVFGVLALYMVVVWQWGIAFFAAFLMVGGYYLYSRKKLIMRWEFLLLAVCWGIGEYIYDIPNAKTRLFTKAGEMVKPESVMYRWKECMIAGVILAVIAAVVFILLLVMGRKELKKVLGKQELENEEMIYSAVVYAIAGVLSFANPSCMMTCFVISGFLLGMLLYKQGQKPVITFVHHIAGRVVAVVVLVGVLASSCLQTTGMSFLRGEYLDMQEFYAMIEDGDSKTVSICVNGFDGEQDSLKWDLQWKYVLNGYNYVQQYPNQEWKEEAQEQKKTAMVVSDEKISMNDSAYKEHALSNGMYVYVKEYVPEEEEEE